MNTIWAVVGLGMVAAAVAVVTSLRRSDSDADLGAVSHHWIAEQRMGSGSDSRR